MHIIKELEKFVRKKVKNKEQRAAEGGIKHVLVVRHYNNGY